MFLRHSDSFISVTYCKREIIKLQSPNDFTFKIPTSWTIYSSHKHYVLAFTFPVQKTKNLSDLSPLRIIEYLLRFASKSNFNYSRLVPPVKRQI